MNFPMVVKSPSSSNEGIMKLHNYLYSMEGENNELLEIYEQIDEEIANSEAQYYDAQEEEERYDEEIEDLKKEFKKLNTSIKNMLKSWDSLDRNKKKKKLEKLNEKIESVTF